MSSLSELSMLSRKMKLMLALILQNQIFPSSKNDGVLAKKRKMNTKDKVKG